jgi:HTH-type transcriptional regulator/antitoxin HigA
MTFDPDWVVSPGETLRDWLDENGLSARVGARACRLSPETFDGILRGTARIVPGVADKLESGTMIPARLWLNLERAYRDGLAAGKIDASGT